jgi:hypothetical protein
LDAGLRDAEVRSLDRIARGDEAALRAVAFTDAKGGDDRRRGAAELIREPSVAVRGTAR